MVRRLDWPIRLLLYMIWFVSFDHTHYCQLARDLQRYSIGYSQYTHYSTPYSQYPTHYSTPYSQYPTHYSTSYSQYSTHYSTPLPHLQVPSSGMGGVGWLA
jgi:hypothetical protein